MITYTFQKVRLNGVKGWIVTRRVDGVHAGKAFGKTKKEAVEELHPLAGSETSN